MNIERILVQVLIGLALALTGYSGARAETCDAARIASAVDAAGASLRKFNADTRPKLKAKLERLAGTKGWPKAQAEEKGLDYLQDGRVGEFDASANDLLAKVDMLGRTGPGAKPDCTTLAELQAAAKDLLGVMQAKSAYMLDKVDLELALASAVAQGAGTAEPDRGRNPEIPAKPGAPAQSWDTKTAAAPPPQPSAAGEPAIMPPDAFVTDEAGYTIDEIQEASRGFFGTISTGLASVIEHAFAKSGRPTAYILGTEGGGAFLAGLRYGKGTMYLRSGGTQPVYWHGPSIGSDIGADGSRTLYLVYRLKEPDAIFRSFAGIDGSAYLVGGIGITFLKGGDVIMAPIRSGLGLRLGANIGYVRFTPTQTWNPF